MNPVGLATGGAGILAGLGMLGAGMADNSGALAGAGVGLTGAGSLVLWVLAKIDEKTKPLADGIERLRDQVHAGNLIQERHGVKIEAGLQRLAALEHFVDEQRLRTEREADDARRRMSLRRNAGQVDSGGGTETRSPHG